MWKPPKTPLPPNLNPKVLVDAVVHAVNEDYQEMAGDFIKLGFLTPGTDTAPIVPALEKIWRDSRGQSLADFNFRWGGGLLPNGVPLLGEGFPTLRPPADPDAKNG